MSDREVGRARELLADDLLHQDVRVVVQRRGWKISWDQKSISMSRAALLTCFVEDEHLGAANHRPRETQQLPLAFFVVSAGERAAPVKTLTL